MTVTAVSNCSDEAESSYYETMNKTFSDLGKVKWTYIYAVCILLLYNISCVDIIIDLVFLILSTYKVVFKTTFLLIEKIRNYIYLAVNIP